MGDGAGWSRGNSVAQSLKFVACARGELEPPTEGSTKAVAQTRRYAGIVKVQRYGFSMP
jgi:hypothetical protein